MGDRDEVMPDGAWAFDAEVTGAFDDMLARSIPQLDVMRESVSALAARRLRPGLSVVDVGCSRGGAMASLLDRLGDLAPYRRSASRVVGVEVSAPMAAAAAERFVDEPLVEVIEADLRVGLPDVADVGAILAVLTVQFTPIEHRLRIIDECRQRLVPGGALLLVEKVIGASAAIDREMVDLYYERKRAAGYTEEQIERKRLSLEGVLVPVTARWNEEMLRSSGFREVDCFWRCLNFAGWIAVA